MTSLKILDLVHATQHDLGIVSFESKLLSETRSLEHGRFVFLSTGFETGNMYSMDLTRPIFLHPRTDRGLHAFGVGSHHNLSLSCRTLGKLGLLTRAVFVGTCWSTSYESVMDSWCLQGSSQHQALLESIGCYLQIAFTEAGEYSSMVLSTILVSLLLKSPVI